MAASMMCSNNRSSYGRANRKNERRPQPMSLDHPNGPFENRVGRHRRLDGLAPRSKTRGLPALELERERSIALDRKNLHLAGGTGYQAGSVASVPDGGRSLGSSGRHRHDVIAGAQCKVRTFGECIECNGSIVYKSQISGIVAENNLSERGDVELTLTADRQYRVAIFMCSN